MFFVFGPSGQMYRGGPENLAKISPVRSVRRPLALRSRLDPQGDGAAPFPLPPPPAQNTAPTPPTMTLRAQDAVSAYARTEQGPQVARQPLTKGASSSSTPRTLSGCCAAAITLSTPPSE